MNIITQRPLSDEERLGWLRLIRSENVGPVTFRRLLERFGTIDAAIEKAPELARRGGKTRPLTICRKDEALKEMEALHNLGGFMLASCEPDYPAPLRHIDDAPPVISILGSRALLSKRMIALVGSRNASLNGKQFTERLARDCTQGGLVVVSGLARGIDTAAHKAALLGGTVAVVAGGIDVVYPEENIMLYQAIKEKGAIIAESPFGTPHAKQLFPKRNRIISGLCEGVVIVEAVQHSGSLITARMALEQGREVFAVPGSPLDPRAKGNNSLLKQGAILVENVQDIFNGLAANHAKLSEPANNFTDISPHADDNDVARARTEILAILGPTPVRLDDVIRETGLPAALILAALLELELAGKTERQPGQMVALIA